MTYKSFTTGFKYFQNETKTKAKLGLTNHSVDIQNKIFNEIKWNVRMTRSNKRQLPIPQGN